MQPIKVGGIQMRVIIDRFEGNFAVCEKEDRAMINIEKSKLPSEVKEGDVLVVDGDKIVIDVKGAADRKQKIKKLMDDLWE
jgi:hypothetical protein